MRAVGRYPHATLWYTAEELDWIARDYANKLNIEFEFAGSDSVVYVPRDSNDLAYVVYSHDLFEPVLTIYIDRNGRAHKHLVAIAVDGSFIKAFEVIEGN